MSTRYFEDKHHVKLTAVACLRLHQYAKMLHCGYSTVHLTAVLYHCTCIYRIDTIITHRPNQPPTF